MKYGLGIGFVLSFFGGLFAPRLPAEGAVILAIGMTVASVGACGFWAWVVFAAARSVVGYLEARRVEDRNMA